MKESGNVNAMKHRFIHDVILSPVLSLDQNCSTSACRVVWQFAVPARSPVSCHHAAPIPHANEAPAPDWNSRRNYLVSTESGLEFARPQRFRFRAVDAYFDSKICKSNVRIAEHNKVRPY